MNKLAFLLQCKTKYRPASQLVQFAGPSAFTSWSQVQQTLAPHHFSCIVGHIFLAAIVIITKFNPLFLLVLFNDFIQELTKKPLKFLHNFSKRLGHELHLKPLPGIFTFMVASLFVLVDYPAWDIVWILALSFPLMITGAFIFAWGYMYFIFVLSSKSKCLQGNVNHRYCCELNVCRQHL